MTEAGLPGQEAETILLALAPAGTPKPIVDMLQREIVKAVKNAGRGAEARCVRLFSARDHAG